MELLMSPFFDQYDSADWPLYGLDASYHSESVRDGRGARQVWFVDSAGFSRRSQLARESEVIHSRLISRSAN